MSQVKVSVSTESLSWLHIILQQSSTPLNPAESFNSNDFIYQKQFVDQEEVVIPDGNVNAKDTVIQNRIAKPNGTVNQPGIVNQQEIASLLNDIACYGAKMTSGDASARLNLLDATRELSLRLETPIETLSRWEWAEPALGAALRIAYDIKLFEKLDKGLSKLKDLASVTETDPRLLNRILKHLASMRVIQEVGVDTYAPTTLSEALINPSHGDGIPFCFDVTTPALNALPKFLASTKYTNPSDPDSTAFKIGHNTSQTLFEYLGAHPESALQFNHYMEGYRNGRATWTDPGCVDVESMLGKNASKDEDAVLLIDIGGGTGRDIMEFQRRFPHLPGRLVLQDIPSVIDISDLPVEVEAMQHDFFTSQPILGARAYYMHSVLHDWADSKCVEILQNIVPVLKRGYSKLLINENVVPDVDADWKITALDMVMMASFSSKERTEADWRALLGQVGLKISRVWEYERGSESLIECELA